jgi:four helix bundle protein
MERRIRDLAPIGLDAYRVALEVLAQVAEGRWPADLRDQVLRAATSAVLNLAEGYAQPRGSRAKKRHYEIALGSACEVAAGLDAAVARGHAAVAADAARLCALCGGLVRYAARESR